MLDLPELFAPARIVSGLMSICCLVDKALKPHTVKPEILFFSRAITMFLILIARAFRFSMQNPSLIRQASALAKFQFRRSATTHANMAFIATGSAGRSADSSRLSKLLHT